MAVNLALGPYLFSKGGHTQAHPKIPSCYFGSIQVFQNVSFAPLGMPGNVTPG